MNKELFSLSPKNYGGNYKNHLFEQYKIYLESIEKISDRRQSANNYFITINLALISLIGLTAQIKEVNNLSGVKILLSIVGIIVCIIFWFLIRAYKQINTGKFNVVHKIEENLPLSLYKYEWEVLGKGQKINIYFPFSHIERWIPIVFGLVYLILGINYVIVLLGR